MFLDNDLGVTRLRLIGNVFVYLFPTSTRVAVDSTYHCLVMLVVIILISMSTENKTAHQIKLGECRLRGEN